MAQNPKKRKRSSRKKAAPKKSIAPLIFLGVLVGGMVLLTTAGSD